MTRDDLLGLQTHDNIVGFLRLLRHGESNQDESAYKILYGGSHFESFEDHPRIRFYEKDDEFIRNGKKDYTTAAGAYQITESTWNPLAKKYGLNDFGPTNQDIAALALIHEKGAIPDILAGRIREAIAKCSRVWASLPGAGYGQPEIKLQKALQVYQDFGGHLSSVPGSQTPKAEVKKMAFPILPLIAAFGPELAKLIPALGSMFGSGSEVATRNVAAATMVIDSVVKATDSPNLQTAIERMQEDPEVLRAAKEAASEVMYQLSEAGGGGIEGARKSSANPDQLPFWKQGAFWISVVLVLMPFMLLVDVFFVHPNLYDGNLRTQIVTGIMGVIAIVGAFWLGSTFGSQRKDAALIGK